MNIIELRSRLVAIGDYETGIGAVHSEVHSAMERLCILFPFEYVWFLLNVGWLSVKSSEIFGLGADVPLHLDLVAMTISERTVFRPYLPEALLPLMNDGFGNHYCLDTARLDEGRCPVIFWNHESTENETPVNVAATFEDWLESILGQED